MFTCRGESTRFLQGVAFWTARVEEAADIGYIEYETQVNVADRSLV